MGSLFSQPEPATSVMVMGFSDSGRTTLIERSNTKNRFEIWRQSLCIVQTPRHRLSLAHLNTSYKPIFTIKHYVHACPAIIYIIDMSSQEYWQEAANQIKLMREFSIFKDKALLVLLNKSDIKIKTAPQLVQRLEIRKIYGQRWKACQTNFLTGQGVSDAFNWLDDILSQ